MMAKTLSFRLLVAGVALAAASAAGAHHSQSEFDFKSTVEVEGFVTNLDWRSPHSRLYVEALDAQGKTVNWDFELPSPMTLMRRGWKRDSLKPGEKVKIKAATARHFPNIGYAIVIRDGSGKPLFTGVTQIYEPEPQAKTP
ncbi:MAG TPA: DUF6152 family protein [Steroidobacteraceae bacterium]|nr:DUF6152 family protein [Steroidobacteraceae bacterium]